MSQDPMAQAEDETTLELSYNDDPKCPYCGESDEEFLRDYGVFPKYDGDALEVDCQACEKAYVVQGHIEVSFTSYRKKGPPSAEDVEIARVLAEDAKLGPIQETPKP